MGAENFDDLRQFSKPREINPWISTLSGRKLYFLAPTPDMIDVHDLAAGLSRQARWAGQTTGFYSVAQHSVLASKLCTTHPLEALLHDATEAYMGDMPRPLKDLCPDFRAVEERLWRAIAKKFGVDHLLHDNVHHVDNVLLMTERRDLQPNAPPWDWEGPEPHSMRIVPWPTDQARTTWLARLRELLAKRKSHQPPATTYR